MSLSGIDPRTPVIVGVAAASNRSDEVAAEPIAFMSEVAEAAIADGAESLRSSIQMVRVVRGIWPYLDPGRVVAERLGLRADVRTGLTSIGGNEVYDLVGRTANDIARGDLDSAVLCSAETMRTRRRDRAAGRNSTYLAERDGAAPHEGSSDDGRQGTYTDAEAAVLIHHPAHFYALAETALRHDLGESPSDHRTRVSELWAGASTVAASNPDAWYRTARTASDIATASPTNRPVAFPYPKLMTANVNVDQAGAVIMCSAQAAHDAGIDRDRWIVVRSHTGAHDTPYVTNRRDFVSSPAMATAGPLALSLAGLDLDDCAHVDLYSCFPVAVQIAQRELGLAPERPFTITGGLTFAGGPLNGYCMQALVRGVQLGRSERSGPLLLTGNGGFLTKHSFLVLDTEPGAHPFRTERPQEQVDAIRPRSAAPRVPPTATIEAYTVLYGRDGAAHQAILSCLDADANRLWAISQEESIMTDLLTTDRCNTPVDLRADANGLTAVVV